jgi:DNA repair protein RecN (Recombination protein N)
MLSLRGGDERIAELAARRDRLTDELAALAAQLTQLRQSTAERLADAVLGELAALAMPAATVRFVLSPLPELGPWGAESVQILFSANPGSAPAPLAKAASGGELSRVRLALEVVLAGTDPGHTFVFDEVDAGVGGAVGLEIGRRLARLARSSQVVVVTHLAQVAAFADRHFVVSKSSDGQVTTADMAEVTGTARVDEVARMMGGLSGSAAGRQHARDLLAEAGRC